jgi:hypothetical protein
MSGVEPSDPELIRRAIEARLAEVHTSIPAMVISYDATTQTCEVQPLVKRLVPSDKDGVLESESYPRIKNVPVAFPRTALFVFHFPLAFGDTVYLLCPERSIAEWRTTGIESAPGDARLHPLAGAVALPGLYPAASPMVPSGSDPELGHVAGPRVSFGLLAVEVGPAPEAVALAAGIATELAAIQTAISGLGGTYVPSQVIASTTLKASP